METTTIPGYVVLEQLYCSSRTLVYRGMREADRKVVVLKLLRCQSPTFDEIRQFCHQYTIAKHLNLPGIVRPYALEPYRQSYVLVMEDFGGISLRKYAQNRLLTWAEVLAIAIEICHILHDFYLNRVIHKDLKPDNILIHPQTKEIKIIDFSLASLLPKETQEVKNPNVLEGTLAYLSPEQTGRMNRGIDYRSDFYSLGVTLYELLTGHLPFPTDNPMELVHCHIAKYPSSVCQLKPEIPEVLGGIVGKLMAKNAENRYQSALGLKFDLERCWHQLNETGKIDWFELGQRDISDRFSIPEKLYGREAEVQTLLDTFERVANGSSELLLITGLYGIGKTAVVNEVHKPIVSQRGYFIKGKFDQFNLNIPFSALVQAFRDLMSQLLSESDAELHDWRTKILKAVGDNGQVIIDVIPELEQIIGTQPPVPKLSGIAVQNRFNLLFAKFIQVFATKEHPLVIFLDDLHWADSASLNLIQLLMSELLISLQTRYLLFQPPAINFCTIACNKLHTP
ncbi:ATP-binding protein [Merismopedia glauca]|uniref:ATP-binding protein n=1 Tax=Merismopedia glauca TaxID=292586 RepID=UPI001FE6494C|nr:serine/threonine-protein kinase [Merismopedia glauca]